MNWYFIICLLLIYPCMMSKKTAHREFDEPFPLANGRTSLHECCKKLLRHHQILLLILIVILFIKKPALVGAGLCNIFQKYQYGSLTPNLRKKTPPRKPYCIYFFHCCYLMHARKTIFFKNQNKIQTSF